MGGGGGEEVGIGTEKSGNERGKEKVRE